MLLIFKTRVMDARKGSMVMTNKITMANVSSPHLSRFTTWSHLVTLPIQPLLFLGQFDHGIVNTFRYNITTQV